MVNFESKGSARARLHKILTDWRLHSVLLVLLVIDLVAVVIGGVLEVHYLESKYEDAKKVAAACAGGIGECIIPDEYGDHSLHDAEVFLIVLSIVILSLFLLEHLVHLCVLQLQYFSNWHHPFDLIVVFVSLCLEIFALTGNLHIGMGILVSARLWRFARIVHGSAELVQSVEEPHTADEQDKNLD